MGNHTFSLADGVSLKEYFESRLSALEQAVRIAASAMDKRLDSMNEFRDTLRDQASRLISRDECGIRLDALDRDIRVLRESKANLEGKASQQAVNLATLLGVSGLILGGVSLVLNLLDR